MLLAASVDTPEENRRFAESLQADFPILSDPDKGVARAYGVLSEKGSARRWTFYIGPDGRIVKVDRTVHAATAGADVAAALTALEVPRRKQEPPAVPSAP